MAYVKIKQDDEGTYLDEESIKVIPVVTQNDKTKDPGEISAYYLSDFTNDMADVHDVKINTDADFSKEKIEEIFTDVFDSSMIMDQIV
jgi:hypothetical protein